jgi:GrpB-like predicted nucleotidyltransferase (UPF0157 family)
MEPQTYYDSTMFSTDLQKVAGERYESIKAQDAPLLFCQQQPYEEFRRVFREQSQRIIDAGLVDRIYQVCLESAVCFCNSHWQVGSSSIRGMPGMFGVDMLAVAPEWPLSQAFIDKLDSLGFRNGGNSPHAGEKGLWFFKRDDPLITVVDGTETRQQPVGTVFHVVCDDKRDENNENELVPQFITFREYCRQTEIGFEKYKQLKTTLAAMEGQSKLAYKIQKNQQLAALKVEARAWWKEKGLRVADFQD